eukprot:751510-Hanusia_phi.AAC.1
MTSQALPPYGTVAAEPPRRSGSPPGPRPGRARAGPSGGDSSWSWRHVSNGRGASDEGDACWEVATEHGERDRRMGEVVEYVDATCVLVSTGLVAGIDHGSVQDEEAAMRCNPTRVELQSPTDKTSRRVKQIAAASAAILLFAVALVALRAHTSKEVVMPQYQYTTTTTTVCGCCQVIGCYCSQQCSAGTLANVPSVATQPGHPLFAPLYVALDSLPQPSLQTGQMS